jgi:hypothetical protein
MKRTITIHDVQKWLTTLRSNAGSAFEKTKIIARKHPFHSTMAGIFFITLLAYLVIPHGGKILPVDPHMVAAYELLGQTDSGKELLRRVKRSTAGSYIYLSLGTTERDRLIDFWGDTVRGVTRSTFEYYDRTRLPKSITVITNRDLVGTTPRDIIRSIAFELENVDYSFRNPTVDFPGDSPLATITQRRIMEELYNN